MDLMPFDELNHFKEIVTAYKSEPDHTQEKRKRFKEDVLDYLEWLLIEAYVYGNVQARDDLGILDDEDEHLDPDRMREAVHKKIADKTFVQRITEYIENDASTVEDFQRVAETDATRVYNTAVLDTAELSGIQGVMKRWNTAGDDRVRDTHEYLYGMTVPYKQDFYTYDGDHAPSPGLFSDPSNNINCRCTISLVRE